MPSRRDAPATRAKKKSTYVTVTAVSWFFIACVILTVGLSSVYHMVYHVPLGVEVSTFALVSIVVVGLGIAIRRLIASR